MKKFVAYEWIMAGRVSFKFAKYVKTRSYDYCDEVEVRTDKNGALYLKADWISFYLTNDDFEMYYVL